jgi:hypothetical protein
MHQEWRRYRIIGKKNLFYRNKYSFMAMENIEKKEVTKDAGAPVCETCHMGVYSALCAGSWMRHRFCFSRVIVALLLVAAGFCVGLAAGHERGRHSRGEFGRSGYPMGMMEQGGQWGEGQNVIYRGSVMPMMTRAVPTQTTVVVTSTTTAK